MGAYSDLPNFLGENLTQIAEELKYSDANIAVLEGKIELLKSNFPQVLKNIQSCIHNRDRRTPLEYAQDLVASWIFEDYIVKKTTKTDGDLEMTLALRAFNALEGIKVNDYTIRIVKPQIFYDGDLAYIVTEYMGTSLQEFAYDRSKEFSIEIDTLFDLLDLFLSRGVLYRGFLPRNTIVKDKVIYLLDWEDTVFDSNDKLTINLLWKTNFLLNRW